MNKPVKSPNPAQKWFDWYIDFTKYKKLARPVEVDFSQPWWKLLLYDKRIFGFYFLGVLFTNLLQAGIPYGVGYIADNQNLNCSRLEQ